MRQFRIHTGDALEVARRLESGSVQTVVTSPPYFGLRDYGTPGQLGLEATPEMYVERLVSIFREVRRVLRDDGTLWLNLGDSYANDGKWGGSSGGKHVKALHGDSGIGRGRRFTGLKSKDLIGIPWLTAFALRADGWYLRQDIIWAKGTSGERREGNVMPESVEDRCTKAHEYLFLLSKSPRYYFNAEAIKEPAQDWGTRDRSNFRGGVTDPKLKHNGLDKCDHEKGNRRSVWRVNPTPFKAAHFAVYPPELIEPCVLAASREGDTILDPFTGSGTTGLVALRYGRNFVGAELNPEYVEMARNRIRDDAPMFNVEVAA